ncbi:MAG: hypothetical protein K8R87_05310 [Verrucomicrobia bacterium]|nr:hypothetical protein [Verrucomicrobiota bacterium]
MSDVNHRSFIPSHCCLAVVLAICVLSSCETTGSKIDASLWEPASKVKRSEVIAIATAYVQHRWQPTEANILHGMDEKGIRVDTPDKCYCPGDGVAGWWLPDQINIGLPYKWGGFDTPEQFDAAIKRGLKAGDAYTAEKRELNNDAISEFCAGIDCSGFISRCWRLAAPFSTYEIAKICDPLDSFEELKPGDVVNKENEHICLFAGFAKNDPANLIVYDVGCPPHWKAVMHLTPVEWLREHGYKPWRYRGIVD